MIPVADIAAELGSPSRCGPSWSCLCPVHGDTRPSLSIREAQGRLIVHCFVGCDPRDIYSELEQRGLLDNGPERGLPLGVVERTPRVSKDSSDRARQLKNLGFARRIWNRSADASGTLVQRYLEHRGWSADRPIPGVLRFCRECYHRDRGSIPAMVARVDDADGHFSAVRRTYFEVVSGRWQRIKIRHSLGPVSGGAVRLSTMGEIVAAGRPLVIGEGIESTFAAAIVLGQPGAPLPCWAAGDTSGLKALVLPPEVQSVIIAADNDDHRVGQNAAIDLKLRLTLEEGRHAVIRMPPDGFGDFNDFLMRFHNG